MESQNDKDDIKHKNKNKIENIIYFYEKNNYKKAKFFINKYKNEIDIKTLIDLSFKYRNIELLKLIHN